VAYDEGLAERVRDLLALHGDVTERKMFGGIAWMVGGNMACGVLGDELIVRMPREDTDDALAEPHVREFDFTGKPMKGIVMAGPAAIEGGKLGEWVEIGVAYAASLPVKEKK
jgi:TfoX/Sxy family transcriptional regulator of competence genes